MAKDRDNTRKLTTGPNLRDEELVTIRMREGLQGAPFTGSVRSLPRREARYWVMLGEAEYVTDNNR